MRCAIIFGLMGIISLRLFSQDAPVKLTRGELLPDKLKAAAPTLAARYAETLAKAEAGDAAAQQHLSRLLQWGEGAPVDLLKAFEWAKKSATANHALGQYRLGIMYRFGTGVDPDEEKSNEYFKRAAAGLPALVAADQAAARRALAHLHYRGWGGMKMDKAAALREFQRGADAGDVLSLNEVADQYWDGRGVRRDRDRARSIYREILPRLMTLGEAGSVQAMYAAGNLWGSPRTGQRDYSESIRWFRPGAEQGFAGAQFLIGARYSKGWEGVPKDDALAMNWYRKAEAQGHSGAINNIGYMHSTGRSGDGRQDYAKALAFYRRAAERGNAVSQNNVALRLKDEGETDEEKAALLKERFDWHRRSAENDYHRGQFNLAQMYDAGEGVEPDLAQAAKWYRRAAANDSLEAQAILSEMCRTGRGVPQDLKLARHWLARMTEFNRDEENQFVSRERSVVKAVVGKHGELTALLNDGWPARLGEAEVPPEDAPPAEQFLQAARLAVGLGQEVDDTAALQWAQRAADGGLPAAQFVLAVRYEQGRGRSLDDKKAFQLYKLAADQGHAAAANQFGAKLAKGESVASAASNAASARKYFTRAAEGGHADGMFNLAMQLAVGTGGPADDAAAVKWLQRAATLGQPDALNELGARHLAGQGVKKDAAQAARLFRIAAWQGHAVAQYNYGGLCQSGTGVDADLVEAFVWWVLAAQSGHERSADKLDKLFGKLTLTQQSRGRKEVANWVPQLFVQHGELK